MKTYATYRILGGELELVGEVHETKLGYFGIICLRMSDFSRILVADTDQIGSLQETWDKLNEVALKFIDEGFKKKS